VIPFYEEHGIPLQRVLTDRGTEYCGTHDRHEYELYLAVENIDHTRTKTKSPQTTDEIEQPLFQTGMLSSPCAWATAWRRAGDEVKSLPRSLH
jgi:hypothetical protein